MRQKELRHLLRKYREGRCTPEEEAFIEAWYSAMAKYDTGDLSASEKTAIKARSLARVRDHASRTRYDRVHGGKERSLRTLPVWSIAAAVLLLAVSLLFMLEGPSSAPFRSSAQRAEKVIRNNTGDVMDLQLSDGSNVELKPNSRIIFTEPFEDHERHVTLEGEAFFEVTRDTLSPFIVSTNEVVTRVLGTSFTVSAFSDDDNIVVSVTAGKVSVVTRRDDESGNETILTPNQMIVYDKTRKLVSRGIVNEPRKVLPPEEVGRLRFEAAPVSEIFEGLEKVYGVDIEFDREVFSSCKLTTSIAEGNIFGRLEMICKAVNATYRVQENRIIILGAGCRPGHK